MSQMPTLFRMKPQESLSKLMRRQPNIWRDAAELFQAAKPRLIAKVKRSLQTIRKEREYYTQLVSRLKRERQKQKLNLHEMSRRIGIAVEVISRLESGITTNPTLITIQRYAQGLGMRIEWRLIKTRQKRIPKSPRGASTAAKQS